MEISMIPGPGSRQILLFQSLMDEMSEVLKIDFFWKKYSPKEVMTAAI
jgi:hypothetical protein